jgi:cytochrome c oxidase subunit 3
MPTLHHPGVSERPTAVPDDGDHGGRIPPHDEKYTGGGGDGDDWSRQPQGRRGPRERLINYRFGVFFALAGDLMYFVALVGTFFVGRASGHYDAYNVYINDWLPISLPSILWLNTAVILLSSVTMEIARRGMFHENDVMEEWLGIGRPTVRRVLPWLLATIVLGLAFLAGQTIAWRQIARRHPYIRGNPSSHYFYLLTVNHAVHLALGIFGLIVAAFGLRLARKLETRQILVDSIAWFWHAMGALWLFLFGVLVWFQ